MSTIPGHPLTVFLGSTNENGAIAPNPATLSALHDADVILGRDRETREEFVVFGRETLQRVAQGEDAAEGYNVLCVEINQRHGSTDLELLIAVVTSVKGRHDFIDYRTTEAQTSDGQVLPDKAT